MMFSSTPYILHIEQGFKKIENLLMDSRWKAERKNWSVLLCCGLVGGNSNKQLSVMRISVGIVAASPLRLPNVITISNSLMILKCFQFKCCLWTRSPSLSDTTTRFEDVVVIEAKDLIQQRDWRTHLLAWLLTKKHMVGSVAAAAGTGKQSHNGSHNAARAVQASNRRALGDIGNLVGTVRCNVSKDSVKE
jgi:hypothetical protein